MTPEEQAVIDAAIELYDYQTEVQAGRNPVRPDDEPIPGVRLRWATTELLAALEAQASAPDELVWVARTLADVRAGDTVRLPAAPDLPARVLFAMPLDWHVRSGGDGRWAFKNDVPLEHRMINVRLDFEGGPRDYEGRPILREMPATTPIEIQLSAEELRAIELLGWDSRVRSERADG